MKSLLYFSSFLILSSSCSILQIIVSPARRDSISLISAGMFVRSWFVFLSTVIIVDFFSIFIFFNFLISFLSTIFSAYIILCFHSIYMFLYLHLKSNHTFYFKCKINKSIPQSKKGSWGSYFTKMYT